MGRKEKRVMFGLVDEEREREVWSLRGLVLERETGGNSKYIGVIIV